MKVHVRHCRNRCFRNANGQTLDMQLSDAPRPDHAPTASPVFFFRNFICQSSSCRRYVLLRAAHSLGFPMPGSTSCSTTIHPSYCIRRSSPCYRRKVHLSFPQLAKHAVADGFEIVPLSRPRFRGDPGVTVLEVHMPDPCRVSLQRLQRVASPEPVMSHVEAQPDPIRIGELHQRVYFFSGLHESGAVMVKHRPEAVRTCASFAMRFTPPANPFQCSLERPCLGFILPACFVRTGFLPLSSARTMNGLSVDALQSILPPGGRSFPRSVGGRSRSPPEQKLPAGQGLVSRFDFELNGIRGHEPPVAQLGAGIAGFFHFIEHPGIAGGLPFKREFKDPPGAGCIGDCDIRGSSVVVLSSFCIPCTPC